jgi:hypothetical protein
MDEAEFERRLHQLIAEAREANAPILGAYSVRSPDPDVQDYSVEITRVANRLPREFTNE